MRDLKAEAEVEKLRAEVERLREEIFLHWPHAIERAVKAEVEMGKLQTELETLRAQVEKLKWREETTLRWLDDRCCPPGMTGNRCRKRSCGQCFREALDREEARERGKDGDRVG